MRRVLPPHPHTKCTTKKKLWSSPKLGRLCHQLIQDIETGSFAVQVYYVSFSEQVNFVGIQLVIRSILIFFPHKILWITPQNCCNPTKFTWSRVFLGSLFAQYLCKFKISSYYNFKNCPLLFSLSISYIITGKEKIQVCFWYIISLIRNHSEFWPLWLLFV